MEKLEKLELLEDAFLKLQQKRKFTLARARALKLSAKIDSGKEITAKIYSVTQGRGQAFVVSTSKARAIDEADLRAMGLPVVKILGKVQVFTRAYSDGSNYLSCRPHNDRQLGEEYLAAICSKSAQYSNELYERLDPSWV